MDKSRLTIKFQATIPKKIRKKLNLHAGDELIFEIENNKVTIKKAEKFDNKYYKAIEQTLGEWNSEEDEIAFKHLQNI